MSISAVAAMCASARVATHTAGCMLAHEFGAVVGLQMFALCARWLVGHSHVCQWRQRGVQCFMFA